MRKIASLLVCAIVILLLLNSIQSASKRSVSEQSGVQATPAPLATQSLSNAPRRVDITPIPVMGVK